MIDLAAFYAAIVNEGLRVTPYAIDSIEQNGHAGLQAPGRRAGDDGGRRPRRVLPAAHHPRRRGGARHRGLDEAPRRISSAARPAPPKTRTTPGSSASPATSPSRSGSATTTPAASARSAGGQTGGRVAVPIAEPIIQATWNLYGPKTPLPPPSAEAARHLKALPIDFASGQKLAAGNKSGFTEYFKLDANKRLRDTQYALAGRHSLARGEPQPSGGGFAGSGGPGPRVAEERQYVSPSAGGRLPPSNRVPRNLKELFGL